jgi:hypothetical protein
LPSGRWALFKTAAACGEGKPGSLSEFLASLGGGSRLDLTLTLTLLLLLLHSGDALRVKVPMTILVVAAFAFPRLRKNPRFWFLLAATLLFASWRDWSRLDNHKYLLAYWCIAVCCALHTSDPENSMGTSARLLIGLSFLFAVFWKVHSGDYANGTFFQYALLTDNRFNGIARAFGRVGDDTRALNSAALAALTSYDSLLDAVQFHCPRPVEYLARLMTWWVLGVETLIAWAFLMPAEGSRRRWRDLLLLLFLLTTYGVAPVIGYGWLRAILGLAQVDRGARALPFLYVGTILLLQVYRFPWQSAL